MAYSKQTWLAGTPITQSRMTHIEDGIEAASTTIDIVSVTASEALQKVLSVSSVAQTAYEQAQTARSEITQINIDTQKGTDAWQQLSDAGVTSIKSLNSILSDINSRVSSVSSVADGAATAINSAAIQENGLNAPVITTLAGRIAKINYDIAQVSSTANEIMSNFTGGTPTNIMIRLAALDGIATPGAATLTDLPTRTVQNLISEINGAHESSVYKYNGLNKTYDTLDARFESDEAIISDNTERVSSLETSVINKTAIVTDLNTNDDNKVLAASQGYKLFNILGDSTLDNVSGKRVMDRINTAEDNAKNYADAKFGAGISNANTVTDQLGELDTRLDAIDGGTALTGTSLVDRLSAVETEIDNANGDSTLDGRFDSIEDNINTLAGELGMLSQSDSTSGTRIDTIETNIGTVQASVTAINDVLGTGFSSTEGNTVAEKIAAVQTASVSAAKDYTDTQLALKANISSVTALAERVTTLEGKDTVIIDNATIDSETNLPTSLGQDITPSTDCDYLIKNGNKYYYYRYFGAGEGQGWQLISGASDGSSSGGNNSGYDYISETDYTNATKAVNTDYYVKKADGYHHYRYVIINNALTEIEIGEFIPHTNIKKYNIRKRDTQEVRDEQTVDVSYLELYEYDYGVTNNDFDTTSPGVNLLNSIELPRGGGSSSNVQLDITRITPRNLTQALNSGDALELKFFYTSGKANEGAHYIITQKTPNNVTTTITPESIAITSGDPQQASSSWPTKTVSGVTVPITSGEIAGFYSIDIAQYCTSIGTHTFEVIITDDESETTISRKWDVTVINLNISSTFSEHAIINSDTPVQFNYIPEGGVDKVAHFELIDGANVTILGTETIYAGTSGVEQIFTIPAQQNGVYRLKAYLTAEISGRVEPLTSEAIYRDIIWRDASSSEIFISSPYRAQTLNVTQYDTIVIPYTVAGGNTNSYTVEYYVDDAVTPLNTATLSNTNNGEWTYVATLNNTSNNNETHVLKIKVGNTQISTTINVAKLKLDLAPVVTNLAIDFNPLGMSNSSQQNREWTNGTYSLTVSNNFDWYNGGYKSDNTGSYFLVKAGTRAYFDYKMFTSYTEEVSEGVYLVKNTVFRDGAEMKIIFKTAGVRKADAIWFSNMGKPDSAVNTEVGIQLNVHDGWLKTNGAAEYNEDTAATNKYLYFPYSEEDKIELDININAASSNATNFFMSYEDGVPSKAYAYTQEEKLYHEEGNESIITIGSDDCDVYIYRFKIYSGELSTEQVLRNFIADGKDVSECRDRYNRNAIYWDTVQNGYVPYKTTSSSLDPERLAQRIPNVKVLLLETPQFTENKKDFIPYSSLRCIHAPGGTIYPSRGKLDNWLMRNGYHAGQGTTSDKYGDAGRNVDFLFNCDGIHNPSDKVSGAKLIPGYKSELILGYGTDEEEEPMICLDWKDEDTWASNTTYTANDLVIYNKKVYKCITAHTSESTFDNTKWALQEGYSNKVSLTATSVPNNFFNMKVNIASSENVNNALLQKRFNDFLPYISPAKNRDNRIKNDMEFVPAVLFVKETGILDPNGAATSVTRREFNDNKWHFYALGNIGDSKKTDYTRAYDPDDMNEFTIEISDNDMNNSQFQTGMYYDNNNQLQYETYYTEEQFDDDGKSIGVGAISTTTPAIVTNNYAYPISKAQWTAVDNNGKPLNMRYWSLMNEKYDGKHSFEFRYACKGDYRDGKVVNDTTGRASAQYKLNQAVWQAFYTWVVTSDNYEFETELDQWCVKNAVEFFYAFTHYYTMMDNRAKNTFWHFAKTGIHHKVSRPVPGLLHIYDELINGEYVHTSDSTILAPTYYVKAYTLTTDTNFIEGTTYYIKDTNYTQYDVYVPATVVVNEEIPDNTYYIFNRYVVTTDDIIKAGINYYTRLDNNYTLAETNVGDTIKYYYTQYAFDLWDYDNDTALGIDNNGELIFPYGREDGDYRILGNANSGFVFNGAGSVFWKRLRDECSSEIRNIFTGVNTSCFNAQHLIEQFDNYQNCYPESIWRLDIERKYIRPFKGTSEDNSIPRTNTRFLKSMMQGRKKYHRRQWVKNQDVYFGSKYMLSSVANNAFTMDCYNPDEKAIPNNYNLTITPYQDMYINVDYGGTQIPARRAVAGEPVEIVSPYSSITNTRIYVYGSNYIQGLAGKAKREDPNDPNKITGAEGLASLYFGHNDFSHNNKLRELNIGTTNTNYKNANFIELNINVNSPILEILNLQNCGNLSGILPLSQSTNLKSINARGTSLTQVQLPSSTNIETLHLPSTVNTINLQSAKRLSTLTIADRDGTTNISNLTTLNINDSDYSANINWISIAEGALSHLSSLYLLNLSTASIGDIDELSIFVEKRQSVSNPNLINLSGILNVTGEWSTVERDYYGGTSTSIWPGLNFDTTQGTEVTRYHIIYKYTNDINNGAWIYDTYYTPQPGETSITISEIYNSSGTGVLTTPPTKASTPSHYYEFGTINNEGTYNRYSGWKYATSGALLVSNYTVALSSIGQNNTVVIETVFIEKAQSYPVEWYLNSTDSSPIYISRDNNGEIKYIEYGGNYNGRIPTVQDIKLAGENTYLVDFSGEYVGYKIFNGWSSAPTNLTLNEGENAYKIYGNWISVGLGANNRANNTVTINSIMNQEELSIEKALILSQSASLRNDDNISADDRLCLTMGYDGIPGGQLLTNANGSPFRFTGNTDPQVTNISPFNSTNDAFTLAIDYKFDTDYSGYSSNTTQALLAGCYEVKTGPAIYGFRLFMNPKTGYVYVGFGNATTTSYSKIISNPATSQYRNIIVLRHPKNSDTLYVYSGIKYNSNNNAMDIYKDVIDDGYEQTLTWDNINTEAKLVFGSITNSTLPTQTEEARGTIYWAKYWNQDLGAGECKMLAAWPHEKMEFAVEDYSGMANRILPAISGYSLPNITFTAMTLSSYIGPVYKKISDKSDYTSGEFVGWNESWYKEFANQKFFFGLPIKLQSILTKTPVYSHQARYNGDGWMTYNDNLAVSNDYIFAPSYSELTGGNNIYTETDNNRPYDWVKDSNIQVYTYNVSNAKFNTTQDTSTGRKKYMNLRFPYKAINLYNVGNNVYATRIFKDYDNSSSTVYDTISDSFTVLPGDIFIKAGDNIAYMFVTKDDISAGAPVAPNSGIFECPANTGGWVRTEYWWTRSTFGEDIYQQSNGVFIFVRPNAECNTTVSKISASLPNYNNQSVEALTHNAIGGCMIYSFGI